MADPERIARRLDALWEIARGPGGGADRPAYSPAEAEAMTLVAGWAREAGLNPAIDPHGNLWALPGGDDGVGGPLVSAGSHVDTVPDGGRYDGALGTVLGLELALALGSQASPSMTTDRPRPALLVCAAEEAPRFGAGTVGSRLLTGMLDAAELERLRDAAGISAGDARRQYLAALDGLPRLEQPPLARLRAHAEIHVALRFGPAQIGVVTHVASPRRLEITVTGASGHSGEIPMAQRRDALAAAAEMTLAIESAARAQPPETVATVGTLAVEPGALSVIPGRSRLGVDMRGIDAGSLDELDAEVRRAVAEIAVRRGVEAEVVLTRGGTPATMDTGLVSAALQAGEALGIPAARTWSGAGHDAQHVNALAPALLMFVPLHGGESHTPQEGAEISEILEATAIAERVLAAA